MHISGLVEELFITFNKLTFNPTMESYLATRLSAQDWVENRVSREVFFLKMLYEND